MRTTTVSKQHPVIRRSDGAVVAWKYRVTLAEGEQSTFDDLVVAADGERRPEAWTRRMLDELIAGHLAEQPPGLVKLHAILDARLAVVEIHDFDIEGMAP